MQRKSIITKYTDNSVFSGTPTNTLHHCIFGNGMRKLADEDKLTIPLTDAEHNMSINGSIYQLHGNPVAEKLSKMLGQMAFEKNYLAEKLTNVNRDGLDEQTVEEWSDEAREAFRNRYGISYL